MEEENRKGPGIFYAVVGVATLVVAIIGATFAYFSASATGGTGAITGQTADVGATALSVSTTKFTWSDAGVSNTNLVPAVIDEDTISGNATADGVSVATALTNKCVSDSYTGCHVWKIVVSSTETIDTADVLLDLSVTPTDTTNAAAVKANWKYVLFTATEATNSLTSPAYLNTLDGGDTVAHGDLSTDLDDLNLNYNLGLTGNTPKTMYLMVFLDNENVPQNTTRSTGDGDVVVSTNDTGSYTGTVTLNAGGSGQVKATFGAQ